MLSIESDDSSGEFDHSLILPNSEEKKKKNTADEDQNADKSRVKDLLAKRGMFPEHQEI